MMISGNLEAPGRKENAGTAAEPPVRQGHQVSEPQVAPAIAAQRIVNSQPVRPASVLALQRLVGNRAVQRLLSRSAAHSGLRDENGVAPGAGDAVDRAHSSQAESLPDSVRELFESRLDADLSRVRVHTGPQSAEAADAVGARAYTVGQDIHFAANEYSPATPAGIHLLAHEVAHTMQNRDNNAPATPQMQLRRRL